MTAAPQAPPSPALTVAGVSKTIGAIRAVDDVNLTVARGEVHGLVGENGAGKSTVLKIIAGSYAQDAGTVSVFGEELPPGHPRQRSRAGIAMMYQELSVVPHLTVLDNVFLGDSPTRFSLLRRREMREKYEELTARFGVAIPADARTGELGTSDQQMVELLRALARNSPILVMDEPTASLALDERHKLHAAIRAAQAQGTTVVLISHDLTEVLELTNTVTVMRNGKVVASRPTGTWTKPTLVEAMLGHASVETQRRGRPVSGDVHLRVDGLNTQRKLRDISLHVERGEIHGIAGLVGSGRTTLLRSLAGHNPDAEGRLEVDGEEQAWPHTVRNALRLGIALAPEDRKGQGLVLGLPGYVNVTLPVLGEVSTAGFVRRREQTARASEVASSVGFNTQPIAAPVGNLSGGNQQKLLIAKWLIAEPRILLLDEPSRGIDVGAKEEIFAILRKLADQGLTIIFTSSAIEEVVAEADRITVLSKGAIAGRLEGDRHSVEDVLRLAFDVSNDPPTEAPLP
ncbi:MAG: ribose transport system ATP-binding protein [Solirubrobacteraceae bacterium]|nr:ribose transport system ATP-binding protein [Solirubrobacteraceae bacterium]